jgi:hypothetical protein
MTGKIFKMGSITKEQIIAINTIISNRGLKEQKKQMILDASEGRTESSKCLTFDEASVLLQFLNGEKSREQESIDRMVKKLFAMAYDLRWISNKTEVTTNGLQSKKDYFVVYSWVLKYGYLGKELKAYKQNELPKLITQFEQGPYAHYLKK